jgi:hypothetical protein
MFPDLEPIAFAAAAFEANHITFPSLIRSTGIAVRVHSSSS